MTNLEQAKRLYKTLIEDYNDENLEAFDNFVFSHKWTTEEAAILENMYEKL